MSKPDDGGPIQGRLEQAFLIGPDGQMAENHSGDPIWHPVRKGGVTVRDGFAAMATDEDLAYLIPQTAGDCIDEAVSLGMPREAGGPTVAMMLRLRTRARYQWADAMIAERKREAPE